MGWYAAVEASTKKKANTDERYTRWEDFFAVEKLLGVDFTLDACAKDANCAKVPRFVAPAQTYGCVGVDGLKHSWASELVFDNCPYSDIGPWCRKHWSESSCPFSALYIPNDRADRPWWQKLVEPFLPSSLRYAPEATARAEGFNLHGLTFKATNLDGRPNFDAPGGISAGDGSMFGIVVLSWDRRSQTSGVGSSDTRRRR